ncbi:polyhomeotic-like protein 3 isoform X2 [Betta splendens]|uniref:Polyhomeotic-like protein 3 isoform X2 n=1 Tax=Betta splendens TaxID=158456 RepID=A0A6P7M370_BETSP|nr:polyhomeotic-like protein 3 isoform X2 [Betta splendens]
MDRELVRQNQSDHRDASNGTSPQASATTPSSSTPTTPTPPRLTPNPMLLDSPAPALTPTTSSPPPPLTPAPSVSSTHAPKVAAGGTPSPHILIPAPPKLTSTATPALRTYSRPILPSPAGKTSSTQTPSPSSFLPPSSSSSSSSSSLAATSTASSLLSSSSGTHSNTPMSTKTSTSLTNGTTRPVSTPTSTPITPFHTPASPPGRQVSQAHPVATPGLMRANQSPSPVRQRVSQQTLLLGKGLKGSGQDQVLLRAQMLQSLTLRPPPPGALTIPPSLRLKPPSSAPPPLSRPHALPIFPPLRPRPHPSTMTTDGPATPTRHLAVPPPTLYSPVQVPLRPRLHSPKGHRASSPRQTSSFQPITAAPSGHACPARPSLSGLRSTPLSQPPLGCGQSQHGPLSAPTSRSAASHFERPSAARQLQIIALSSSRQPQPGTYGHMGQSPPAELSKQIKRTLSSDEALPPSLSSTLPKTSCSLPSPPSVLSPASSPGQAGPQTQTQKGEVEEGEEHRERGVRQAVRDEGSVGKVDQRETAEEKPMPEKEVGQNDQVEAGREEEQMEVTEEGQGDRDKTEEQKETKGTEEEEGDAVPIAMDQSDNQNTCPVPTPSAVKDSDSEPKPVLALVSGPVPAPVPAPGPVPEVQSQKLPESHREPESVSQEDFSENMSTQSDNQSALSSLSSQSPPSSPFITPSTENPPPLLPAPTDLSPSQHETERIHKSGGESEQRVEAEMQPLGQSEDDTDSLGHSPGGPWEPKAWPEGRQVLTHLVEGFVIQEGLQPFPVNRSSLLVPEQVAKPQEVNGTNGSPALPVMDPVQQTEPSTDSEEEDGVDTDDGHGTRSGHRDRTVLHCQFCGKRGHAHNFMRSKRFCSTSCARGFNVRLTKRLRALSAGGRSEKPRPALNRAESVPGKPLLLRLPRDLWSAGRREKEGKDKAAAAEEEEMVGGGEEEDDGGEEDPAVAMTVRMDRRAARRARRASAPAVTTSTPTSTFKPAPSQWSVEDVTAFIHALPGCSDVAEAFRVQEIDGQALLLLTEDHLMTSMNIKLGPALKICAHINALKNQ